MKLENLSDSELHVKTVETSKKEKEMTLLLLDHLREVDRRKLYASKGYGSLWEYVQKALGYSEAQAYERISAMRFMARDEKAKEALETGKLSLTQAAQTERFLKSQEKEAPLPKEEVQTILSDIEGRSKRETEKILLSHQTIQSAVPRERIRQVTEDTAQVSFPMTEETRKAMERYWQLNGKCSVAEVVSQCLEFFLEQKDPEKRQAKKNLKAKKQILKIRKSSKFVSSDQKPIISRTLPAKLKKPSRYISKSVRREVQERSTGQCEYVDPESNRRCESQYLLQFDHIHPFAWGGDELSDNIRQLCAVHNGYLAEKMFARESVGKYSMNSGTPN